MGVHLPDRSRRVQCLPLSSGALHVLGRTPVGRSIAVGVLRSVPEDGTSGPQEVLCGRRRKYGSRSVRDPRAPGEVDVALEE